MWFCISLLILTGLVFGLVLLVIGTVMSLLRQLGGTHRVDPTSWIGHPKDGAGNVIVFFFVIGLGCILYVSVEGDLGILKSIFD